MNHLVAILETIVARSSRAIQFVHKIGFYKMVFESD